MQTRWPNAFVKLVNYLRLMLIRFNKPFEVLCQFTDGDGRQTLADFIDIPKIYAAGRLDRDSEGLLLLTDDGKLQSRISHPRNKQPKTYCVQVDGEPNDASITELRQGIHLKDGKTRACEVQRIAAPDWLWPREPPVRYRKAIPTSWLEITITEGRNRQVRRMTAAVNHPTLRLIRTSIGNITLDALPPGAHEPTSASKL